VSAAGAPPAGAEAVIWARETDSQGRLGRLVDVLELLGPVVVAFSGGADSTLLAVVATRVLGRDLVHCVTADSASLAPEELADCEALATEWDLRWSALGTSELEDPSYVANGLDRCYHCKNELMTTLAPVAVDEGGTVVLGVNLDDLGDHRPGQRAAAERGAAFPLVDAGLTKSDVRALSRILGLRTWDKPAAACLASRLPYGTPVTLGTLRSVAVAESGLHALGFTELRVRHHGDVARVEVPEGDLATVIARRGAVVEAVKAAGDVYGALDLEGFRSGSLNRVLVGAAARAPGADPGCEE